MQKRLLLMGAGLALALTFGACGGDDDNGPTPLPTPTPKAVIHVLIDPNPVTAVSTGRSDYPWDFRVNVQVSDSGGVGFRVTSMSTTITSALSGAVLASTTENPFAGVTIPAYGQSTKQFHMGAYRMEYGTRQGVAHFVMNFTDDAGNAFSYDGTVNIANDGDPVGLVK